MVAGSLVAKWPVARWLGTRGLVAVARWLGLVARWLDLVARWLWARELVAGR